MKKQKSKSIAKSKDKKTKAVRKYEGASKSKRLSRWVAGSTSADQEIFKDLVTLRNRARDLRRNNPYAASAVRAITSNVIGTGIVTQFRGDGANVKDIEAQWNAWAESKDIDYEGRNNIYGLQHLIFDAVVESGEVLVLKRYDASKEIPLQYQVLESDFLADNKTEVAANGNQIVQGIEYSKTGKRVAYHIYESHPGGVDASGFSSKLVTNRIPAENVYHIFRADRPGQNRGVSWLSPVIVRLKDLDDYEDAQLVRQKIAACFTVFVRDIGAEFSEEEDCEELSDRLEPGIIEHLPAGKTVDFAKPPEVQNYKEYVTSVLHSIASGIGCTYEVLTNDFSNVNYSSARMGWIEFGRSIKTWRERLVYSACLDFMADEFLKAIQIKGKSTAGVKYLHVAPIREMIDPTREIPAITNSIRAGLTTLTDELLAMGKDPQAHIEQYAKDKKAISDAGLILDSDPSKVMKAGVTQTYVKDDSGDTTSADTGGSNANTQAQS